MNSTNPTNVELCPNCRRDPHKHRPWCSTYVANAESPKIGDIVNHSLLGPTELVSVYLRSEAIADGQLIDCTQDPFDDLSRDAGLIVDVAVTRAVFERYIQTPDKSQLAAAQNIQGRYWDLVSMFARKARQNAELEEMLFEFICVVNDDECWANEKAKAEAGSIAGQRLVQLKAVCHGGDRGEPCVTFMLPTED